MPYEDALRDGIILCKLMNRLQPGLIPRINTSGGDYKSMDNINQYVGARSIVTWNGIIGITEMGKGHNGNGKGA